MHVSSPQTLSGNNGENVSSLLRSRKEKFYLNASCHLFAVFAGSKIACVALNGFCCLFILCRCIFFFFYSCRPVFFAAAL